MIADKRSRPDVVLIAGPTASGKSALALDIAKKYDGEIINTDSMQVYDGLQILTARPNDEDLAIIPHHLYGHVPVSQTHSVSKWLVEVKSVLSDLKARDKVPVFVGGTGLYFDGLLKGIADIPDISASIRDEVREMQQKQGSEALHARLQELDPVMSETLNPGDGQRLARALEVVLATGHSLSHFHDQVTEPILESYLEKHRLLLMPDRSLLHERIEARAKWMLDNGAIEEVESLQNNHGASLGGVSKAIGYSQILDYLDGKSDFNKCYTIMVAKTRQYSKRQYTWFKNRMEDNWKTQKKFMK